MGALGMVVTWDLPPDLLPLNFEQGQNPTNERHHYSSSRILTSPDADLVYLPKALFERRLVH